MTGSPTPERTDDASFLDAVARIRRLLYAGLIGLAAIVGIGVPAATALYAVYEIRTVAAGQAAYLANKLSSFVSLYPDHWTLMGERLSDMLDAPSGVLRIEQIVVEGAGGVVVARTGTEGAWPRLTVSEPLTDGAMPVGRIVLDVNMAPALERTAAAGALGAAIAMAVFLALRLAPFRIADQALARLTAARVESERQRREADAAREVAHAALADLSITEQRATSAETRLRDAINSSQDAWTIYDSTDRLVFYTANLAEMTSHIEDFQIGVSYEELVRHRHRRGIFASLGQSEDEFVDAQLAARHGPAGQTLTYQRSDGRWFLLRTRRMADGGVVNLYTDITDLKVAEARASQAETLLRDAINASTDLWFVYDKDDRLVHFTQNLVDATPHPEDYQIGTPYEDILRQRFRRGMFTSISDDEDSFIATQLAARHNPEGQTLTYKRADGKWLLMRTRLMANGGIANIYTDITELKEAEDRVKRAEVWLRDAIDTSGNVLLIWDSNDRLALHTADLTRVTTYPEDFQIGVEYETFLRLRIKRGIVTQAIGREEDYVRAQLAARHSFEGQNVLYRRPDGVWWLIRSRPMSDGGTVQVYIDVTELKAAEERVSRAELRLRNAVDCMADGFRLWDAEDRLVLYNRAFEAQSATPEAVEIGRTYEETLRMAVSRGVIDSAKGREEDYIRERLAWHRQADGRPFDMHRADDRWFEVREYRTEEGGTVYVRADITERKRREAELGATRDAAVQASRAKSEFLSKMSHDLRTPLNAVLGFSQLLLMERGHEALTRHQHEAVETIERTGRHLLSMVEDILDLARIENNAIELATEPLSLAALCSEVLTLVQPLAEASGVSISHDVMRAEAPQVLGDHKRVIQVMTNLVSNAVKYGSSGGRVVIAVEPASGGFVHIAVTDFGPGIPIGRQGMLFQPFSRLGQESSTTEGTGIGLTIARGLVERMGGAIGFDSAVGRGTTFWFTLPAAVALTLPASGNVPVTDELYQVRSLNQVGPATILYVEDTLENRALVRRLLGRFPNIRYLEAESAETGIEMARRERPDVVLMDMRLPGMSGLEALRLLRADPATRAMTVIGLTGAAMPHEAQEIRGAGFDGYITKPFRIAILLDALVQALDRRARARRVSAGNH